MNMIEIAYIIAVSIFMLLFTIDAYRYKRELTKQAIERLENEFYEYIDEHSIQVYSE